MVEIVKEYGPERIMVNSAADWGISDPLAVPKTAALMVKSGIGRETIEAVCYQNALTAFGQSGQLDEVMLREQVSIDQGQKFEGNSILRGGQQPRRDAGSIVIS